VGDLLVDTAAVRLLNGRYMDHPEACFGAEARAAFRLRGQAGQRFPIDRFMLRPPLEPVVLSYWDRFRARGFTQDAATALVSALSGAVVRPRTEGAVTRAQRGSEPTWRYPDPDHAAGWLDRLYSLEPDEDAPFIYAAGCFAEVVRSHPYPNGNGRLGRAFFHGALAEVMGLTCPFLPLGPAMYLHAETLTQSLRTATRTNAWRDYHRSVSVILREAMAVCDDPTPHADGPRLGS
jgi:hypothetical protein